MSRQVVGIGGAFRDSTGLQYLHQDHLSSTSLQSSSTGAYEGAQCRGPYGQPWRADGALDASARTEYQYTGQRSLERSLGSLDHYQSRWYSPVLGRFLQADTIVPGAGNPQNLNRYSYVRNNPLKHTDPTGHCICEAGKAAGEAVGGLVTDVGGWLVEHWAPTDPITGIRRWVDWARPKIDASELARKYVQELDRAGTSISPGSPDPSDPDDKEREDWMREHIRGQGYREEPWGKTDGEIAQRLQIRGPRADGIFRDGIKHVVSESKGRGIGHAVQQLDNTVRHLLARNPGISASNVEARIYINPETYQALKAGVGTFYINGQGFLHSSAVSSTDKLLRILGTVKIQVVRTPK